MDSKDIVLGKLCQKSPYFEGKKSLEATIFSQCYPQGHHNKAYDSKQCSTFPSDL